MIPRTGMTQEEFDSLIERVENKKLGNKDYKIVGNRVKGFIDGIENLIQSIKLNLSIERYNHLTVSDDVGVELEDSFGSDLNLIEIKIKSTITEALLADDRIKEVSNFELVNLGRNKYGASIDIVNNIGEDITIRSEVIAEDE